MVKATNTTCAQNLSGTKLPSPSVLSGRPAAPRAGEGTEAEVGARSLMSGRRCRSMKSCLLRVAHRCFTSEILTWAQQWIAFPNVS